MTSGHSTAKRQSTGDCRETATSYLRACPGARVQHAKQKSEEQATSWQANALTLNGTFSIRALVNLNRSFLIKRSRIKVPVHCSAASAASSVRSLCCTPACAQGYYASHPLRRVLRACRASASAGVRSCICSGNAGPIQQHCVMVSRDTFIPAHNRAATSRSPRHE